MSQYNFVRYYEYHPPLLVLYQKHFMESESCSLWQPCLILLLFPTPINYVPVVTSSFNQTVFALPAPTHNHKKMLSDALTQQSKKNLSNKQATRMKTIKWLKKEQKSNKTCLKESSLIILNDACVTFLTISLVTGLQSYTGRLGCKKHWNCEVKSHLHTSPSRIWRWNLWGKSRNSYRACSCTGHYHTAAGSPDTRPHLERTEIHQWITIRKKKKRKKKALAP